jgi:hypothetical protein
LTSNIPLDSSPQGAGVVGSRIRITRAGDRHTIEEISSGELAALVNLLSAARRAGVKPTELQEEVLTVFLRHLAKTPEPGAQPRETG